MIIFGRNVIIAALETKQNIKKIYISKSAKGQVIEDIKKQAKMGNYAVEFSSNQYLDKRTKAGSVHQGVLAELEKFNYSTIQDLEEKIKNASKSTLTIILDQINDPHNLGAIIRTAECAGCTGLIIPNENSADINATVLKVSVGAAFYIPIIKSQDLLQDIHYLKRKGIVFYASFGDAEEDYLSMDSNKNSALIIGNEATGIRKSIKKQADHLIKIPLYGKTESLNASVAAGISIYSFFN